MMITEIAPWPEGERRFEIDGESMERLRKMVESGQIVIMSAPKGMLDWPQYRDDRSEALRLAWEAWRSK